MKIGKNKFVSLIYELRESDPEGRIIEVMDENRPLTFIFGSGKLLPVFEENINSLNNGDRFRFTLNSGMAYGEKREEMIVNVPIDVFMTDGKINEDICRVGNEIPMMDTEGVPLNGIIVEITNTFVRMDFNHPMAGFDLFFSGKIVDVREPSEAELSGTMNSCSGCSSKQNMDCQGNCG